MKPELLEQMILEEIKGKNAAIHAYDKMMWTVRSGYLTLVFAGWGFAIKAAIETVKAIGTIMPYIFLLSAFTIALSVGAFMIDRNYARRKFRVIVAINKLTETILTIDLSKIEGVATEKLVSLLQISGDADNKNYKVAAFFNEFYVIRTIYTAPSLLAIMVLVICIFFR
jgi:hypothetical protein